MIGERVLSLGVLAVLGGVALLAAATDEPFTITLATRVASSRWRRQGSTSRLASVGW